MSKIAAWMDRALYPDYADQWDNIRFRQLLLESIQPDFSCLDYGAGRGNVKEMNFKGVARFVAGVDPTEDVFDNPFLDESKRLTLPENIIPYEDNVFDVVFANSVVEHLEEPGVVLDEIFRVLKPGGKFIFKTPNKWHYVAILARVLPTVVHKQYNRLRGRETHDTFPTTYRCNTPGRVRKHARTAGFQAIQSQIWEGRPEYLRIAAPAYVLGYLYERLVNSSKKLQALRCVMVCELRKPASVRQSASKDAKAA